MSRIYSWLGENRGRRFLFGGFALVVVGLVLFSGGVTVWEYTNSSQFCGTTCHTMPPEYTAYQVSPHARVPCVDCHLGQDSTLNTVPRKAQEVRHVIFALTQSYETPIYVKNLRPARDTCEKCHFPEKFSTDSVREIRRYAEDEENSETKMWLVMKTGGGTEREGLGKGIHWHIENEVWFIATDEEHKQNIPYVRQVDADGTVTEFYDLDADLPDDFVARNSDQLRRMDCIDCHNRISHQFLSPDRLMDQALTRQLIASDIPEIKRRGVELLSAKYTSHEEANRAIEELDGWYETNYADYYAQNREKVQEAIEALKQEYQTSVFPDMDVGWETHPDNIGHDEFPGCFRCHDGKHVSPQRTSIRLECNICHSIPAIEEPGQAAPSITFEKQDEPESHLDTNWLGQHRFEFDRTCATCHDVSNPGGSDNSSFCANSACHATEWEFVGLDAPGIRALLSPPAKPPSADGTPPEVPHPVGPRTDCLLCHGPDKVRAYPENHVGYEPTICTGCHQVVPTEIEPTTTIEPSASAPTGTPTPSAAGEEVTFPAIPHTLEGRDNCLLCHALDNPVKPVPEDHEGRTNDLCRACHQPAT